MLLLAHGITDNGLCWTRLAKALEPDYDVIMFDARGHGYSDKTESYLVQDHVADIKALIEGLELDKPALLGHSMGAVNAVYFAVDYGEHVSCLLLEDPPWPEVPENLQRDEAEWYKAIALQRTRPFEDILEAGKVDNPQWDDLEFLAWADAKRQVDPQVVSWLDAGRTLDNWRELVARIPCPTLLLTADGDVRVSPEVAKEAQSLCSSLLLAHIPGAGHSIRRDQFEAYLKAVKSFLQEQLKA